MLRMLPLQQNRRLRLADRHRFFLKLSLFSLCVHGIMLLFCFSAWYTQDRLSINGYVPDDAAIVLLPLIKQVNQLGNQKAENNVALSKEAPVVSNKCTVHKQLPKTPTKKLPNIKQAAVKNVPQAAAQKQTKQVQTQRQDKIETPNKHVQKIIEKPSTKTQVDLINSNTHVVYVGQVELENLSLIAQLQSSIKKQWRKPAGLSEHTTYKIIIYVTHQGNVEIQQEYKSGALALDIAARSFVTRYAFPKNVWGRQIELEL